ncbi:MAG: PrsW family intramembrane metalloprotease [Candidatus Nealsonbacteria bacterium]|nr:PrsW family intramembrane metalloprotease [Candidatus Nealsonbacteria bacterium]
MSYSICLFFGIIPSVIWLLFYLKKDSHPESNRMVLKIFLYGMLIALPTALIELGISEETKKLAISPSALSIINLFLGVALIEEFLKYLVVREKVLDHHEFDEPLDTMLYMIISALGFAASENILIFFNLGQASFFHTAIEVSASRFISATFLHALCSGTFGYFLALSFYEQKNKIKFTILGLGISVLLHGLYNFSIIKLGYPLNLLIPVVILVVLAIFVSVGFNKLKKIKSVCKIN